MGARWVPRSHLLNCARTGITKWLPRRPTAFPRKLACRVRLRPSDYAVTIFVQTLFEQILVGRPGLDLGERQPLVTGAAGRMDGGGVWSLAGSAETPRPKAASNPGPPD